MATNDIIKAGRERLRMTHQAFGDAVGVSRGAVQQWERGVTAPTRKHQPKVAALLGVSVATLMDQHPDTIDVQAIDITHGRALPAPTTVTLAQALAVLGGALAPLDATARRRAGTLLADLADDPASHASLADILSVVIESGKRRAA